MLLTIPDVLDAAALAEVRALAAGLAWQDGGRTAGATARQVKHNEQAVLDGGAGAVVRARLLEAIRSHPLFHAAVRPARFSRLLLSRTREGGGYGAHVDNAFMGRGADRLRTDVSFTLFLSGPDDYDGGALEVERPGMLHTLKPAAGALVLYPSTSLHRVATVTAGERLACVGWAQSRVPDAAQRELLLDLENLRASLAERFEPQAAERLTTQKVIENLLRMWAQG